ncbi:MAG: hypothetical protein ABL925_14675 [Methylococcales bacterium]
MKSQTSPIFSPKPLDVSGKDVADLADDLRNKFSKVTVEKLKDEETEILQLLH